MTANRSRHALRGASCAPDKGASQSCAVAAPNRDARREALDHRAGGTPLASRRATCTAFPPSFSLGEIGPKHPSHLLVLLHQAHQEVFRPRIPVLLADLL